MRFSLRSTPNSARNSSAWQTIPNDHLKNRWKLDADCTCCRRTRATFANETGASPQAVREDNIRFFGMCRIVFREQALLGNLPGIRKASL